VWVMERTKMMQFEAMWQRVMQVLEMGVWAGESGQANVVDVCVCLYTVICMCMFHIVKKCIYTLDSAPYVDGAFQNLGLVIKTEWTTHQVASSKQVCDLRTSLEESIKLSKHLKDDERKPDAPEFYFVSHRILRYFCFSFLKYICKHF
jgi:hypothetical protein